MKKDKPNYFGLVVIIVLLMAAMAICSKPNGGQNYYLDGVEDIF